MKMCTFLDSWDERVLFYISYIQGKNRRICLELCYDPHYFGYLEIFRHSRKWELT